MNIASQLLAEIEAFLDEAHTLQVASVNGDGSVHLVPMWFLRVGSDVWFWTYGKSQKIVNLQRDPRVSVLVATGEHYGELRGVSISGRAQVIEDRDEVNRIGETVFERSPTATAEATEAIPPRYSVISRNARAMSPISLARSVDGMVEARSPPATDCIERVRPRSGVETPTTTKTPAPIHRYSARSGIPEKTYTGRKSSGRSWSRFIYLQRNRNIGYLTRNPYR